MNRDFAIQSVDGLYAGYRNLINCEYLQSKYPEEYRKLQDLKTGIVIHQMSNEEVTREEKDLGPICGCAYTFGRVVNLNPYSMSSPGCKFNRTIPHEIVHLLGFDHSDVKSTEEFKNILFQCDIVDR